MRPPSAGSALRAAAADEAGCGARSRANSQRVSPCRKTPRGAPMSPRRPLPSPSSHRTPAQAARPPLQQCRPPQWPRLRSARLRSRIGRRWSVSPVGRRLSHVRGSCAISLGESTTRQGRSGRHWAAGSSPSGTRPHPGRNRRPRADQPSHVLRPFAGRAAARSAASSEPRAFWEDHGKLRTLCDGLYSLGLARLRVLRDDPTLSVLRRRERRRAMVAERRSPRRS